MSLRHAILTALSERSSSGFELARRFDKSIRFFWSATHQQIYRELKRLEGDGLVESTLQPNSRGNRKLYEVLPQGRVELAAWVARYEPPRAHRDALLVRLRAAAFAGRAGLLEQLHAHHEVHARQRAEYLKIAEHDFLDRELDESARLQHLILRAGVGLEEYWIRWLEEAIVELRAMEESNEDR